KAEVARYEEKQAHSPVIDVPSDFVDDFGGDESGDVSPQYTFLGNFRWFEPDTAQPVIYRINSTGAPVAGGGVTEIDQAMAAWSTVLTTSLRLQNGGSTTVQGFRRDGVSAISFNDPDGEMQDPVNCGGTLAIGGVTSAGSPSKIIGGQSFMRIYEGDVVFNDNYTCFLGISANLAEVACHEIGHSLGFGHSADSTAIMAPRATGRGRGATLGSDDIAVVSFLYPGTNDAPPPPPSAPSAPTSLTATAVSDSGINLAWAGPSTNEDGFRVERKTGSTGVYAQIATLPANSTAYSDAGLAPSTTYYYRVVAFNAAAGDSAYSNQATVTTSAAGGSSGSITNDDSAFVSQTVPATMTPGAKYFVTVTFRNSGETSWGSGYSLRSINPEFNTTWRLNQVTLSKIVTSGAQVTFSLSIIAPTTAGTYNFQWQMYKTGTGFFGQPTTNIPVRVGNVSTGGSATDNASFVSQTAPAAMTAGQVSSVSVTMRNSGTTTWAAGTYKLASQNPAGNLNWGVNQVSLGVPVAPGGQATFSFNITAPSVAGSYSFQWRMQNGATYFGTASTNVVVSVTGGGTVGTNNAQFVSQSVPASMTAGQTTNVSVTMKNSGTTTWAAGTYKLGSDNPSGNSTWGLSEIVLPVSIAPGSQATFTFSITAPSVAGSYNFQWRMLNGSGSFGASSTNAPVTVTAVSTPTALSLTTTSLATGRRTVFYSKQMTATGGAQPYTWSATGMPSGLSLNSSTGLLSGTPTVYGTFYITVTVRDANNASASRTYKTLIYP
ncbi:MAG TPA: NBR1-Ig-like domain-containing protein, partial [Blastocatellia bacterium]|nr:NBR1-Ig-like domain-containing protein [Blastocatellia bacterium]